MNPNYDPLGHMTHAELTAQQKRAAKQSRSKR